MTKIYCKESIGVHDFYIKVDREEYYLFSQKYRRGVDPTIKNGVLLNKGICHGIGKTDYSIHRTMDKIRRHIRYLENEYDIMTKSMIILL